MVNSAVQREGTGGQRLFTSDQERVGEKTIFVQMCLSSTDRERDRPESEERRSELNQAQNLYFAAMGAFEQARTNSDSADAFRLLALGFEGEADRTLRQVMPFDKACDIALG